MLCEYFAEMKVFSNIVGCFILRNSSGTVVGLYRAEVSKTLEVLQNLYLLMYQVNVTCHS